MVPIQDILEISIPGIALLGILWRIGLRPLVRWLRGLTAGLESIKEIEILAKELKPNGGSSFRDVIDRMERSLMINNQSQLAILDLMNSGFFITDADGLCVHVNRYWSILTGLTSDEAVGTGWTRAVHPEDRVYILKDWQIAAQEGRTYGADLRLQNVITGTVTKVKWYSVAIKDISGQVYGHIGTFSAGDQ